MRSIESQGRTVEEALDNGLKELHLTIGDVTWKAIQEGSKGLFGFFGSRPAKVLITLREDSERADDDMLSSLFKTNESVAQRTEPERESRPMRPPQQRQSLPPQPQPQKPRPVFIENKTEKRPDTPPTQSPTPPPPAQSENPQPPKQAQPPKQDKPRPSGHGSRRMPFVPVRQNPRNDVVTVNRDNTVNRSTANNEATLMSKPQMSKPPVNKPQESKPQPNTTKTERVAPPASPRRVRTEQAERVMQTYETVSIPAPSEPPVIHDESTPSGKAQKYLMDIVSRMGLSILVYASQEGDTVSAKMYGEACGQLIGRRGETLDALQYLTGLYVNRTNTPEAERKADFVRVTLDAENYRAKREDALSRLAHRLAERAIKIGRKVSLEPMNPYERRIIHSTLQEVDGISTYSEGDEPSRYVVIMPKRKQPQE